MNPIDELCRMLDERKIKHHRLEGTPNMIECVVDGVRHKYSLVGNRIIWSSHGEGTATPEQAIAATLGAGTCEMEYVSDFMSWHCKACDQMSMSPRNPKPRYCKWCGRKVVDE